MSRFRYIIAVLALTSGAVPLAAQTAAPVPGCRGYSFDSRTDGIGLPIDYPRISELQPGSPAERAGIQVNDLIVANNGVTIFAWQPPAPPIPPGATVVMTVRRAGRDIEIPVVLGQRDAPKSENDVGLCRPMPPRDSPTGL